MLIKLKGGRVFDPANGVDGVMDVAVRDGRVRRGSTLLLQGVGGGFTWGSIVLRY